MKHETAQSTPRHQQAVYGGSKWTIMDIAQVYPRGTRDGAMEDLNAMVDEPDWVLTSAVAINNKGDIVGTGQVTTSSGAENHGFLLIADGSTPPPPPTGNTAPVTIASANITTGKAMLTVDFNGSASYDPDGDSISFHWDFGDRKSSTAADPTHVFKKAGTYLVVLTVTDGQLTNSTELEIRVEPRK